MTLVRSAVGVLALLAVACTAPVDEDEAGQSADAVQRGRTAEVDSYSVFIPTTFKTACSGTLIAPNLVLTARHCFVTAVPTAADESMRCGDKFGPPPAPTELHVSDRPTPLVFGQYRDVAEIRVPESNAYCGDDIGLLILEKPYELSGRTYATPILTRERMMDRTVFDREVVAIGYGQSAPTASDNGTRRALEHVGIMCVSGDATRDCTAAKYKSGATFVAPSELVTKGGVCKGDSGSGAIEQRSYTAGTPLVIGVASRTASYGTKCVEARYTRTDAHAAFIIAVARDAARRGGYEVPEWAR